MSLIDCPHCGRFISDGKGVCPICERSLSNTENGNKRNEIFFKMERPWNTSGQTDRPICDATYIRLNGRGRR